MNTDAKAPSGGGDFLSQLKSHRNAMKHIDVEEKVDSSEGAPRLEVQAEDQDGTVATVQHTSSASLADIGTLQQNVGSDAKVEVNSDDANTMNSSMVGPSPAAGNASSKNANGGETDPTTTTTTTITTEADSAVMSISEAVAKLNAVNSSINNTPMPGIPTRSQSFISRESRTPATSTSSSKPGPKYRAPSPPRWRFVKEAKSTFGYSSEAAGFTVRGKSSEELGAKYVAPNIVKAEWQREQLEINELGETELQYKKFDKEGIEVGRLDIGDPDAEYEEFHEGGIVISHDPNNPNEPQRNWKEWMKFHGRNKNGTSSVQQAKDRYVTTIESESSSARKYKSVGRLAFDPDDFEGEEFNGQLPRQKFERGSLSGDGGGESGVGHSIANNEEDKDGGNDGPPEQAGAVSNNPIDIDDLSSKLDIDETGSISDATNSRRKWWPLLLLFLLLVAGAITGVVLGTKKPPESAAPEEGARAFAVVGMMDDNSTTQQPSISSQPSASPSGYNLFGNLFDGVSNMELSRSNVTDQPSATPTVGATRFGSFNIPEPPTLAPSTSPTKTPSEAPTYVPTSPPTNQPSAEPSPSPSSSPTDRPSSSSPTNQPIVSLGACPEPFSTEDNMIYYQIGTQISMQGIVYECKGYSCGSWEMPQSNTDNWQVIGSCEGTWAPTSNPTAPPSVSPSRQPTAQPSAPPTAFPSKSPVTSSPTKQPVVFLGGCPKPFDTTELIYYPKDTQVSLNGLVYECISHSCGSWIRPEATFNDWQVIGSCSGSISPTSTPSRSPTSVPSDSPATMPPTPLPTWQPSSSPSGSPVKPPSETPTELPTLSPKVMAIMTTPMPTDAPIVSPTTSPTSGPSPSPSGSPSVSPTTKPTTMPTGHPTDIPSDQPTIESSDKPSYQPSYQPTNFIMNLDFSFLFSNLEFSNPPTGNPTGQPSIGPTAQPSHQPTNVPTNSPPVEPTDDPTTSPTSEPTHQPTNDPSISPSRQPTAVPTGQPTDVPTLGPTPSPTFTPSESPTYEPTRNPTPSPSSSPTTIAPSKQPTPKPTNVPKPSQSPTVAPTSKPTCGKNGNFNLCLAIDMSGSVCNGFSNSLCTDCSPVDTCNTGGQNLSRCCSNFDNIIEFTRSLVSMLGELPTDQDFSIVHFGTDVNIASTLESAKQSVKSLNKLKYSGGKTNMVGAINSCQTTLSNSPPDRKNLMLLITDGAPSVPDINAPMITELAATDVKNQGTFIIPILIEDPANQFIPEVAFLRDRISSDGKVFVADFDGLSNIQNAVFDQVTCQS